MEDLEGEFDPAHYDEAMARVFGEEYYEGGGGEEKPEFSDSGEGKCVWGGRGGERGGR